MGKPEEVKLVDLTLAYRELVQPAQELFTPEMSRAFALVRDHCRGITLDESGWLSFPDGDAGVGLAELLREIVNDQEAYGPCAVVSRAFGLWGENSEDERSFGATWKLSSYINQIILVACRNALVNNKIDIPFADQTHPDTQIIIRHGSINFRPRGQSDSPGVAIGAYTPSRIHRIFEDWPRRSAVSESDLREFQRQIASHSLAHPPKTLRDYADLIVTVESNPRYAVSVDEYSKRRIADRDEALGTTGAPGLIDGALRWYSEALSSTPFEVLGVQPHPLNLEEWSLIVRLRRSASMREVADALFERCTPRLEQDGVSGMVFPPTLGSRFVLTHDTELERHETDD